MIQSGKNTTREKNSITGFSGSKLNGIKKQLEVSSSCEIRIEREMEKRVVGRIGRFPAPSPNPTFSREMEDEER